MCLALPWPSGFSPGTSHKGAMAPGSGASTGGTAGAVPSPKPAAWAARAPAAAPSARQAVRPKLPLAAPATSSACVALPGRKIPRASSNVSLPADWLKRCTAGFQPPETSTLSQAMRRKEPPILPSLPSVARVTARTRFVPWVAAITEPLWRATPASFSLVASGAAGSGLQSTTAATVPPASTMSYAAS